MQKVRNEKQLMLREAACWWGTVVATSRRVYPRAAIEVDHTAISNTAKKIKTLSCIRAGPLKTACEGGSWMPDASMYKRTWLQSLENGLAQLAVRRKEKLLKTCFLGLQNHTDMTGPPKFAVKHILYKKEVPS